MWKNEGKKKKEMEGLLTVTVGGHLRRTRRVTVGFSAGFTLPKRFYLRKCMIE